MPNNTMISSMIIIKTISTKAMKSCLKKDFREYRPLYLTEGAIEMLIEDVEIK